MCGGKKETKNEREKEWEKGGEKSFQDTLNKDLGSAALIQAFI